MKILLVEDDPTIAAGLDYSLKSEGYETCVCSTFADARRAITDESFDLLLLDVTLPDGSGFDLCRLARQKSSAPVIFLTACDEEVSVVMGLDMGADDYVTKPFRVRELLSRIRTVLRRAAGNAAVPGVLERCGLTVNLAQAKVTKNGSEIILTALEYRLLLALLNHEGQTLTRNQLLEEIWDVAGDFVNDNTLTVYVKRLRDKIEDDPQNPKIIHTIRGLGYRVGHD
ncbi:MAG: response regulator transcription factor [Firmicutes bacterium]|nr:response regulator transcription factor [Bacillota bacterium]